MLKALFVALLSLASLCAAEIPSAAAQMSVGGGIFTPQTEYEGAAALGLALRRLGTTKRVLMIGAHPDDESTQIISALALGQGADVAYLSLTRGEGGQNGIGPELQEGLGLLRSEELLAARRLDGARQFFSRAYDFGYSKNADEAFRHWPRDSLLADVVGVIRAWRPDVVVSIFSGTPRDGHGQHQVAGIMAREGWAAAGDPDRFPEQIAQGLAPYAPPKLYQALWRDMSDVDFELSTGDWDPLLGRSFYQVAMASRSRHRSQDMGRPLTPGPQSSGFALIESRVAVPPRESSLFAGIDTTLAGRIGSTSSATPATLLGEYQREAMRLREQANLLEPRTLTAGLADALRDLRQVKASLADGGDAEAKEIRFRIVQEEEDLRDALALAAGLTLGAAADDERVVPGQAFELELSLWNGGGEAVKIRSLAPDLPAGWGAEPLDPLPSSLATGTLLTRRFRVQVPEGADPSEPFYLREVRTGDLYRWPNDPALAALPFEPPSIRAAAEVQVAGVDLSLDEEATFRALDKMQGEFRRPVRVVPAVSVLLDPPIGIVPLAASADQSVLHQPLRFTARLSAEAPEGVAGTLRLQLPDRWQAEPAAVPLRFGRPGEEQTAEFTVSPPAGVQPGKFLISAIFQTEAGAEYARGFELVDYPHTHPRALYRPSAATVNAFEVNVPQGLRVGYVEGAGDAIPDALRQLGIEPVLLDEAALAEGDLSPFDVILTGIRAYEVRPDLVARNDRLLGYVKDGGTLIVQYNKYEFPEGNFAPYTVSMARPHDRVTDESAPVRLLDPSHPILSMPNRISDQDWEGWVQERGLYFLNSWDPQFTPLLEMADPGEEPLRGALLVAPYGEGTYVYTGLSLFRQLPEGVPGAYRLLANLVALGAP